MTDRKMVILDIKGLTEDELQGELTVFLYNLNKYNDFGATVTVVTASAAEEVRELTEK